MSLGDRLFDALMKEADRRQAMGHYVSAHEIRAKAREVRSAEMYLDSSKKHHR